MGGIIKPFKRGKNGLEGLDGLIVCPEDGAPLNPDMELVWTNPLHL